MSSERQYGRGPCAGSAPAFLIALALGAPCAAQVAQVEEAPSESAQRHQVVEGDTLYQLSERYLGSGDAWPKLWSYNPEITNPHWIYPGLVVRLRDDVALTQSVSAAAPAPGSAAAAPALGSARRGLRSGPRVPPGVILIGEEVYLDRDALAQAARIVGSSEDHLMLSPSDEVYLRFKEKAPPPTPGKELSVFVRLHRKEVAARAGRAQTYKASDGGEIVRVLGVLRVKDFDAEKHIARAVVIEARDPIERGLEVADVPQRLAQVPPKPNGRTLQAKVVAATRALSTLGDGQLVFIGAGAKQGVEVGNRFRVVRQGDPWRQQLMVREELSGELRPDPQPPADSELPPERVAELRVLYVRPESSTAVITTASIEIVPGDRVEMRAGD